MNLEAVRIFVRVAELGSFTQAGLQLGLSKARISIRVQELESEVGARLLLRSTRAVRLTEDGAQFLPRAQQLVRDTDEISAMFQSPSTLRGRVRIDLPTRWARRRIIPRLPEFLSTHPHLELLVSTTDHHVDVVREGFDCVLRIGNLSDSGLVARRLGTLSMVNCASPGYLTRFGVPTRLDELDHHFLVGYSPTLSGAKASFEYWDGSVYREKAMQSMVTVNGTDAYFSACLAGLGIIQVPRKGTGPSIAEGQLVEILPELPSEPMPVSLVQAHRRPRKPVRAVMDFIAAAIQPELG